MNYCLSCGCAIGHEVAWEYHGEYGVYQTEAFIDGKKVILSSKNPGKTGSDYLSRVFELKSKNDKFEWVLL